MRYDLVHLVLAAFVALLAGAHCAPASPRAIPPTAFPDPFGVNIHYTHGGPGETAKLAKAYKVVRMDFGWSHIEKKKGVYDWSDYDDLIRELEANGITPLFILDYGNDLYQQGPPRTPEARAGYARWAAAAAKRYSRHAIMWEFWNEPNGSGFWGGAPDASEYARMVNEAAPAMRKADPECTLLVGAFAGFPWDYIETVFRSGALRWADGVTVHPYRSGFPETVAADYARLRGLLAQYAPNADIPILSGEWGYSTNTKSGVSEERQAQYLVRQRLVNASQGIRVSIWYDWKDDGPDPTENEHRFGSVRQDLQPKPAYTAAVVNTRTLSGYSYQRMLKDGPQEYVMLLRNTAGESALALWTTGPERTMSVEGRGVTVIDMLGQRHTDTFEKRDLTFGPSPRYALLGKNEAMDLPASWSWPAPALGIPGGQPVKTEFTLGNPGRDSRTYFATFTTSDGEISPRTVLVTLKPGEVRQVPVTVTLWTRAPSAFVNVEIAARGASGQRVEDRARIPVPISNPIMLSAEPAGPDGVPVTLTAPGGFGREDLSLALVGLDGLEGAKPVSVPKTAEKSVTVTLPARKVATDYTFGVQLRQGKRVVVSVPPRGYYKQHDLELSALDRAPEGFTAHFEGESEGGEFTLTTARGAGHGMMADLRVTFPAGWRYLVVSPRDVRIPNNAVAVGMWVNGDGSGDYLRCRFRDAKGQVYQPDFGRVDWTGWKWVTAPLNNPTVGSWGGPQDGVIHKPIVWDAIVLLDSALRNAHTSRIQFDDITIITEGPAT